MGSRYAQTCLRLEVDGEEPVAGGSHDKGEEAEPDPGYAEDVGDRDGPALDSVRICRRTH